MHDYLVRALGSFTTRQTPEAAMAVGLPAADLISVLRAPEVEAAVQNDIDAGRQLGIRSLPTIIINRRQVPRWKVGDTPRLDLFVDAVLSGAVDNRR
jgi:predicted DsbA family dithiol-disulfide isomerase